LLKANVRDHARPEARSAFPRRSGSCGYVAFSALRDTACLHLWSEIPCNIQMYLRTNHQHQGGGHPHPALSEGQRCGSTALS